MPRGYRCIVVAAIGWLALTGAAQTEGEQGNNAQAETSGKKPRAAAPIADRSPAPDRRTSDQGTCITADSKTENCDRAVAQATIDQSRYSYWQTWFGMLGLIVGFGTLFAAFLAARWAKRAAVHTGNGVTEAAKAAAAAERQLALSEHAFTALERPYILVEIDSAGVAEQLPRLAERAAGADSKRWPIFLTYAVKNFGKTPAIVSTISAEFAIWPKIPPDYRYPPNQFLDSDFVIGAQDERAFECVSSMPYSVEAFESVGEERAFAFFIGRVDYASASGQQYETEFCWQYHPATEKRRAFISQAGCRDWNRRT